MIRRITIEPNGAPCEWVRPLLGRGLVHDADADPSACALVVHELPEFDALAWLSAAQDGAGAPRRPAIVITKRRDPELRRAALEAGAMEVLALDGLGREDLEDAVVDAHIRFAVLRRTTPTAEPFAAVGVSDGEVFERQQRLAFHVENTPLAVVEWGPDFRCTRWTGRAEAMFGWRADEVLGLHPTQWRFVHSLDAAAVEEVMARLIAGEEQRNVSRNRNYRRDGSSGHYEWYNSIRLDADGRLMSVFSLILDATERCQAAAALLESENRFRTLAEASPSITFMFEADGRRGYANSRWQEYFGFGFEHEAREAWRRAVHPDEYAAVRETWSRSMELGETFEIEHRLRRHDGELRWHLGRAVPIRDSDGRVTGWCGTMTDVHRLKTAEEAAQRATELLRAVTETAADPIYAKDREGRMLLANGATLRALSRTVEQVLGQKTIDWLGDTAQARAIEQSDLGVITSGRAETVEDLLTMPDGREHLFLSVKTPLRDADGRVIGLVGLSRDITEQRAYEVALRESEAKAHAAAAQAQADGRLVDAVLEAAPAGIIVADANGRLLRFNAANELLWGPAPFSESVEGYRDWKGWWADQSERHGRRVEPHEWAMARALRGETVRDDIVEVEPFGRPGTRRTMVNSGAPVYDAEGRISGAVVTQMDITALVASEAARRESDERFRGLADNIAQLAWMADDQGSVFWFNKRWFEFTGTALEQMCGWGWTQVPHPEHVDRVVAKISRHFASGEPWEDTFPMRSAAGEYRWFLSRAIPIRDSEGGVVRWFGTNTDVTEQREAEQALREADRRKDEFIAVLAHELRNPLAPVRNCVEILRRIGPTDPHLQRVQDVIDRQVTHMARLIDDLLDVSRIARGKLELDKQHCDLAAIARQTAEDYRMSLEAEGLTLAIAGPHVPLWVEGEPTRLAQMVGNLLHNAGRFTPRGGHVELRTEVDETNRLAVVRVQDDGVGIEPELLARLFDPFSQAGQDFARTKGGLGLGLALTNGLAELHGGGVAAESAGLGLGAAFIIRIPLRQASYEAVSIEPALSPEQSGVRVLVVEDNVDAAQTLGDLLSLLGHEVRLAFDGTTAISAAAEFEPAVVISDLGLPGALDGYDVARRLRDEFGSAARRPFLIALSGYANEQARRRSRDAGFDVHLAKPPDIGVLSELIAERGGLGTRA